MMLPYSAKSIFDSVIMWIIPTALLGYFDRWILVDFNSGNDDTFGGSNQHCKEFESTRNSWKKSHY